MERKWNTCTIDAQPRFRYLGGMLAAASFQLVVLHVVSFQMMQAESLCLATPRDTLNSRQRRFRMVFCLYLYKVKLLNVRFLNVMLGDIIWIAYLFYLFTRTNWPEKHRYNKLFTKDGFIKHLSFCLFPTFLVFIV
jgi:hypothetical protein